LDENFFPADHNVCASRSLRPATLTRSHS